MLRARDRHILTTLAALVLVTVTAAAVRFHLYVHATGGTFLAIGPDASDWVTTTLGLARGEGTVFKPNRYLFVPWLAVHLSSLLGLSPKEALLNLTFYASLLLPAATLLLARRFVSLPAAVLVAAWVAFKPEYLALSLSPIAYPVFALAFVVTTAACLGAFGRWSVVVAVPAALVATASLNQGMLCLLAMLPAGVLVGRWGVTVAAAVAGAIGLWIAHILQPHRYSAFGWMLRETAKYLEGNVAEETARTGQGYAGSWMGWAEQTFQVPSWLAVVLVAVAILGMVIAIAQPRAVRGFPDENDSQKRRAVMGLAWTALPATVLLPLMASAHHLIHLEPLLAVGVALAVSALPWPWARLGAGTVVAGAIAFAFLRPDRTYRFEFQVDQARHELAFGTRLGKAIEPDAALFAVRRPGQTPMEALWRSAWALPPGVALFALPEGPLNPVLPIDTILARHSHVWVASLEPGDHWICGRYRFQATGPPTQVVASIRNPGPGGRSNHTILVYPTKVVVTPGQPRHPATPEMGGHG